MAQGEAHLPTGHSKVTTPLGRLWVVRAPAVSCTHFLCLLGAQVQGPGSAWRRARWEAQWPGAWSLRSGPVSLEVGPRPTVRFPPPGGPLASRGGCPARVGPRRRGRTDRRLPGPGPGPV